MALIDRAVSRIKLRDLRLLDSVVRSKSIARAAAQLNLTAPAVSKAVSELEHILGTRLLDRNRQGIEPTVQGEILLRRGAAIFDELRHSVHEIEHLSDPQAGEVRIAASIPIAAGVLPATVAQFNRLYPRIAVHAREIPVGSLQFETPQYRELRERSVDIVIGPIVRRAADRDLASEALFDDPLVVATATQKRQRTSKLIDLIEEPWCLPPADSVAGQRCIEAFRSHGLEVPRTVVSAMSIHLQIGLLAAHRYYTMFPGSLMRFAAKRFSLRALPIKLRVPSLPIGIVTLKGRTPSPPAELFIRTVREITKPLRA